MEEKERCQSPSRRTSRVEQVVGRWLRRSRESSSSERTGGESKYGTPGWSTAAPIKLTVKIPRDPNLDSHGFEISVQRPLLVADVTAGGPAEGRLVPGDQVLTINSVTVDDLSSEQAAEIIKESWDYVTVMVLRQSAGPKSSFMTAEKRARLKTNPVKVHFAEEVVVNGHTQGNSLLFLPNVLKVYLENGQTKAFKFEAKTTVKDIVLTLREKLSIRSIEHFALVLEEQYSVSKLLLLHEEEHIQQVVHRKEAHDYRCLFRVCFMPRDPLHLLQEDPVAFEYLYLQSVNDVLQERFAVEMKCNTALRLAALHIHERLDSCGHTHRASLKSIAKNWGIENFISPTLLRNMNEKDLRKAINYHMKKIQAMLEPRQKVIPATQARLNYLSELGELQSYGGKCFTATILFQDSECMVNLLIGARYGISQVINHKLNLIAILTDFSSITRVDLLPESERVSLVKIYLQDVKQITLLMESLAAKDLSCLVTGYCRLYVDSAQSVFSWSSPAKTYRISTEPGCLSQHSGNTEDVSVEEGSGLLVDLHFSIDDSRAAPSGEEEEQKRDRNKREGQGEVAHEDEEGAREGRTEAGKEQLEASNLSHSNLHTDSITLDNLDNLDDDDLLTTSSVVPLNLEVNDSYLLDTSVKEMEQKGNGPGRLPDNVEHHGDVDVECGGDGLLGFADLSQLAESLPSPPEATDEEDELQRVAVNRPHDHGFTVEEGEAQRPACVSLALGCVDGAAERSEGHLLGQDAAVPPLLQPSPSFVDSSSEDEFFDAHDRFIPPATMEKIAESFTDRAGMTRTLNLHNLSEAEREREQEEQEEDVWEEETPQGSLSFMKTFRKRRSFIETNFTSQVSFPTREKEEQGVDRSELGCFEPEPADTHSPCFEPELLDMRLPQGQERDERTWLPDVDSSHLSDPPDSHNGLTGEKVVQPPLPAEEMEMEPDTMEYKPVTGLLAKNSALVFSVCNHLHSRDKRRSGLNEETSNGGLDCPPAPVEVAVSGSCSVPDRTEDVDEERTIDGVVDMLDGEDALEQSSSEQALIPCTTLSEHGGAGSYDEAEVQLHSAAQAPLSLRLDPSKDDSLQAEIETREEDGDVDIAAESESVATDQCGLALTKRSNSSCLALVMKKGISHSCESLLMVSSEAPGDIQAAGITTEEPTNCNTQNRASGIVGRLSSSSLRDRIRKLPCCLSRSQEHLGALGSNCADRDSTHRVLWEDQVASEDTEVTEAFTEDMDVVVVAAEEVTEVVTKEPVLETKLPEEVNEVKSNTYTERSELNLPLMDTNLHICKHPEVTSALQSEEEDRSASMGDHANEVTEGTQSRQPKPLPHPYSQGKVDIACPPVLQVTQASRDTCGCKTAYSNCFRGEPDRSAFDEDVTVHEFSCRTQGTEGQCQAVAAPSTLTPPSIPPFSRGALPRSCSSELSPLLSPLDTPDCYTLESPQGALNRLRARQYALPGGFALLQRDLLELLAVLRTEPHGGARHHWETCVAHLSENKHRLHAQARRLMSDCQRVIRAGQSHEEMLHSLGQSFRTLVQLAATCLCFSSCCQCEGSLADVLCSLQAITRAYGDFSQAAELACGRKSCHDLSIKVLARQCTTLTASVFCLTQLYCTLSTL